MDTERTGVKIVLNLSDIRGNSMRLKTQTQTKKRDKIYLAGTTGITADVWLLYKESSFLSQEHAVKFTVKGLVKILSKDK